jgi:cytochrome P450 family 150 subfamily A5
VLEVFADRDAYSSIAAPLGPLTKLPEPDEEESLAEVIERRRGEIPLSQILMTMDPPKHTRHRALLKRLLTPNRLKENEAFMWSLADQLIDEFPERGEIEFSDAYAGPFTLLVIADLLGVPREDHETLRGWLQSGATPVVGGAQGEVNTAVLFRMYPYFTRYIEERRASPADDALTQLATVRFSDGALPEVIDVVHIATFLFAAGQESTARLFTTGMRILAEQPALADELRGDPEAIPNFVEECLRFDNPIKGTFRLALRDTRIAGVDIPTGSMVMLVIGAANRDPRVFSDPDRFDAKRPNARSNIAFGHGDDFCVGASLARAEARISFQRLLGRLDDLQLVDAGALSYTPSYLFRGLNALPLRLRRAGRSRYASSGRASVPS